MTHHMQQFWPLAQQEHKSGHILAASQLSDHKDHNIHSKGSAEDAQNYTTGARSAEHVP